MVMVSKQKSDPTDNSCFEYRVIIIQVSRGPEGDVCPCSLFILVGNKPSTTREKAHAIDEGRILRDDALSMVDLEARVSPSIVQLQGFNSGLSEEIARERSRGGIQGDVQRDIPIGEEPAPQVIQRPECMHDTACLRVHDVLSVSGDNVSKSSQITCIKASTSSTSKWRHMRMRMS